MTYAVNWVAHGEMHEAVYETRKEADILQNLLMKEGFCSQITPRFT